MKKPQKAPDMLQLVETNQAEELLVRARQMLYSGSLATVATNREAINMLVDGAVKTLGYGGIPDDIWDMLAMLDELVAGKVDRIAAYVQQTVPAHLAALESSYREQVERLTLSAERMAGLLSEAIDINKGQPISGLLWQARKQQNSSPSVVVTDAKAVPPKYRRRRFVLQFDFPACNAKFEKLVAEIIAKWTGEKAMVAGVTGAKGSVEDMVPAKPIVDAWKSAGGKLAVSGVDIIMGSHMRITPSKAKAGAVQPIPLVLAPKAEPLTPEQESAL